MNGLWSVLNPLHLLEADRKFFLVWIFALFVSAFLTVPSCSLARTSVAEDNVTPMYISSKSQISLGSVLAFAKPHCLLWKPALCLRTTWKLVTFADRVRMLRQNPHSKHQNMLFHSKYAHDKGNITLEFWF